MATLLHIDSSPFSDSSVSRRLTGEYVLNWKKTNPGGKIVTRDLYASELPPVDAEWVGAAYTAPDALTPRQREVLAQSDTLLEELEAADEIVLGVPMHNLSIPSVLKLWIDLTVRLGRTFGYADGKRFGLLKDKKATVIIASGGIYDPGTGFEAYNFIEPYLGAIFGYIGITDVRFILAGGSSALLRGVDRDEFMRPHLSRVEAHFQTA